MQVLRAEINLSLHQDLDLLCSNYSIRVRRNDLKVLSRKQITSHETLFHRLKNKDTSFADEDSEEDEEDDGIMKTYNKNKKKLGFHHINILHLDAFKREEYILSIKTFEVGGKKYLNSLALAATDGKIIHDFYAIVPADFYSPIPPDYSLLCEICYDPSAIRQKLVLHCTDECPGHDQCNICPGRVDHGIF